MKLYLPLLALSMSLLVITPSHVMASCEGVETETLLAAWYDPNSDIIIKRVGEQTGNEVDERYVVEKGGLDGGVIAIVGIGKSAFAIPTSISVIISPSDPNHAAADPQIVSLVKILRVRTGIVAQEKEYRSLNEWKAALAQLITGIDTAISDDKRFIPLTQQTSCPYVIQDHLKITQPHKPTLREVYEKSENGKMMAIGHLTKDAPGDENSPTTIDPQSVCWNHDGITALLAFHWAWECQGEGDLTETLLRLRR